MLLLEKEKIVIITPNKCASSAITKALVEERKATFCIGPQGPWRTHGFDYPDAIGKHSTVIPFWCKDWLKFVVIRNRLSRFVSLWKHYCYYHRERITIQEFADRVRIFKMNPPANWFYTVPLDSFLDVGVVSVSIQELEKELSINIPLFHTSQEFCIEWNITMNDQFYKDIQELA